MPVAAVVAIIAGVVNEVPAALSAYELLKAHVAAGTEPTADEWAAMIANIDAANQAVQDAEPPQA